MKTLGLLGGMSWESTVPYYRIINETVRERPGGLRSTQDPPAGRAERCVGSARAAAWFHALKRASTPRRHDIDGRRTVDTVPVRTERRRSPKLASRQTPAR